LFSLLSGGRLSQSIDFSGRTTDYTVANNKLTRITLPDPDGSGPRLSPTLDFNYQFTASGGWMEVKDAENALTKYTFNRFGRTTKVVDPGAGTWLYTYMKDRGIIVVLANGSSSGSATIPGEMEMIMTNPRGFVTKTKTDRFGLPIEIKYPDGSSEKFERNKHGNPKNHTFPTASGGTGTTTYTYDDRENATQINSPAGVTGIVYDVRSLPISVAQTGRPTQQIARDSYGNAIQVTILPMGGASIAANPDNRYPYMLTYLTNPVDRFDVNNDGFVNQDDQTALQNYVSTNGVAFVNGLTRNGRPVYPDVDGNGIANGSDYAPLASYLASSQLLTENYGYSTGGNNFPRGLLTSHSNTAGETTVY
jgi:YD repeat-containing protein